MKTSLLKIKDVEITKKTRMRIVFERRCHSMRLRIRTKIKARI